jgi:hypothetical protein
MARRSRLAQYATNPPMKFLTLVLSGNAASLLSPWNTIHVQRADGLPLCVGDVLNAIHVHLTRPLRWDEISGMATESWEHILLAFNQRVQASGIREDSGQLVMQRLDLLNGTLFDGIQCVGGEFHLALC